MYLLSEEKKPILSSKKYENIKKNQFNSHKVKVVSPNVELDQSIDTSVNTNNSKLLNLLQNLSCK